MPDEYSEISVFSIDAQVFAVVSLAKPHNFELFRVVFMEKGDGDAHQARVILGNVPRPVHIDPIAVVIFGIALLVASIDLGEL